jgi:hypothetical protein
MGGVLDTAMAVGDLTRRFAPLARVKEITVRDESGQEHVFAIRRFHSIRDFDEMGRKIEGRMAALEMGKGRLSVGIDRRMIDGLAEYFPDFEESDGGTGSIFLTTESEVVTATHLETALESPAMTWAEAAVFTRVAGAASALIVREFNAFNTVESRAAAKNA